MKKIVLMAATAALAFSCSQQKDLKVLVLYYSQNGSTKAVAEEICNHCSLSSIEPD